MMMKVWMFFFLLLLIFSCRENNSKSISAPSDLKVLNYDTSLRKIESNWFYKGRPFTGFMIQQERDGKQVYSLPIKNGKENGVATGIYSSGEKLVENTFVDGKREGVFSQWWPNGNYRYLFKYENDKMQGNQWVFFPSGKKREAGSYVHGEKQGLQRVWDEEGKLVSNYVLKNNRRYGVIAVKSCIPVEH
jgi:antitoxin component YwqK of YwqJK toxin-antitoxin module